MTNQEAINQLTALYNDIQQNGAPQEVLDALDYAIVLIENIEKTSVVFKDMTDNNNKPSPSSER